MRFHETTLREAVSAFPESDKDIMDVIIGLIDSGKASYDEYIEMLACVSEPNDRFVNLAVWCASRDNMFNNGNKRYNRNVNSWALTVSRTSGKCIFLTAE